MPFCVVLGGGGHASVLVEMLQAREDRMRICILDADPAKWGRSMLGEEIRGGDELLPRLVEEGASHFAVGVGGVADNRPRKLLFEKGLGYGLEPVTLIHPSAVCSRWSRIGKGSMLFPGSIVNAGAVIGVNVIVNSGAIVEHDCVIQDHAHIATGAKLASTVRVGACAHVGLGAAVKQEVSIGEGAVIGAGAVVLHDVPPGAAVAGVPARPLERRR
jgi:sugar O-acyltransferase (sialic acid O-acetyltransferase NeuD family)